MKFEVFTLMSTNLRRKILSMYFRGHSLQLMGKPPFESPLVIPYKLYLTDSSHLSNNGVEESPPSQPSSNDFSCAEASPNRHQLFANLEGCNVGFKHWHPIPVTQNGNKLSGQGDLGGVWEWTSSTLEKHEGFEPMPLY